MSWSRSPMAGLTHELVEGPTREAPNPLLRCRVRRRQVIRLLDTSLLVIALLLAGVPSCTGVHTYGADVTHLLPDGQRGKLESLVCHLSEQLWTADRRPVGYRSASAVIVGDHLLLTARHCVSQMMLNMEIDGVPLTTAPEVYANVDGKRARYRLVIAGDEGSPAESGDWALLKIIYEDDGGRVLKLTNDAKLAPSFRIEPGTEIFLVGYPGAHTSGVMAPNAPLAPTILRARVIKRPAFFPVVHEVIWVEAPTEHVLKGMSGGAAVIWDTSKDRPIVIGIYRGMAELEAFGTIWRGVHTVVRLPEEIFVTE